MLSQLRDIDFVECVGDRVIVNQVVAFFLIGDESGRALEQEVKVAGSPLDVVGGERGSIELFQRLHDGGDTGGNVFAAAQGESGDAAGSGVDDRDASKIVEFTPVRGRVSARSDHALLFSGE